MKMVSFMQIMIIPSKYFCVNRGKEFTFHWKIFGIPIHAKNI